MWDGDVGSERTQLHRIVPVARGPSPHPGLERQTVSHGPISHAAPRTPKQNRKRMGVSPRPGPHRSLEETSVCRDGASVPGMRKTGKGTLLDICRRRPSESRAVQFGSTLVDPTHEANLRKPRTLLGLSLIDRRSRRCRRGRRGRKLGGCAGRSCRSAAFGTQATGGAHGPGRACPASNRRRPCCR